MKSTFCVSLGGIVALGLLGAVGFAQDESSQEYYRRLASVPPRDAGAYHELSVWCAQKGLEQEARTLLQRTIRIDPDHAAARKALGYRRHGLGWVLGATAAARIGRKKTGPDETAKNDVDRPRPPTTPEKIEKKKTRTKKAAGSESVADRVAAKRAFAEEAAKTLKLKFNTKEDADFLIHTTHDLGGPRFRKLSATFKVIKKAVQNVSGGSSRERWWPEKVQIFFFRATAECVRFAEIVDGRRYPEREGWYVEEGHAVFHEVNGEHLGRLLGETAVDFLDGVAVNWWLRAGVAEYVASQTEAGRQNEIYRQAFLLVGSDLEGDPRAFHVSDLLELPPRARTETRNRAQALTLIDFLFRLSKRKLHKVIADLKGESAPQYPPRSIPPRGRSAPSPAGSGTEAGEGGDNDAGTVQDEDAFRKFFVAYIAFQQESITKHFMDLDKLDKKWKEFVLEHSRSLKPQDRGAGAARGKKGSTQRPGRSSGPTGRGSEKNKKR